MNETEIIRETITQMNSAPSIETYALMGGLVVSVGLLLVAIFTLRQSNKIQGQNLFHDLVKIEKSLYDDLENIGGRIGIERVLNFYEYLSFLYFHNVIDRKMTERLFKPELIKNYEKFERHLKPDFVNLTNLYKLWKDKSAMVEDKRTIWQRIWDPEDSRFFGELFLIVGGFLIAKWIELIIPNFTQIKWLYFGIGFLFVLYAVKLLRKSEK